jgi:phosphatidylethanolamine/phosphatidyl-N-methylethanolamine N-methyltransferase
MKIAHWASTAANYASDGPAIGLEHGFPERRTLPDNGLFLRAWLKAPLRTGAVKPSGTALARTMAAQIDPSIPGPIVELGPGTGAVTAALVARGVHPSRLILIEADTDFCALLQERWPEASVLQTDAYTAPAIMRRLDVPAGGVVAGLPLLIRPAPERLRLVLNCLRHAAPGAPFVQFTYFLRSPVPAPRTTLGADASAIVWRNTPPARVWSYRLTVRRAHGVAA